MVKRELGSSSSHGRDEMDVPQAVADRRALRSRYSIVKKLIHDGREDLTKVDSDKFNSIINEVESLHELVQNPREQVADAEAFLDIASTLMTSVKAHKEGVTATDFVNCILRDFGQQSGWGSSTSVSWKDIGSRISHLFQKSPQCCTMIGPVNIEVKQRKPYVRTKHVAPAQNNTPEEIDNSVVDEEPETVKNVGAMFNILRKHRRVRLENLVLNGISFPQTVENIFALSFLVRDGRVEIKVNEEGHHIVSPRNAPSATAIASGEVTYNHYVFRFDYKDWKLMKEYVGDGEQLMPHRRRVDASSNSQSVPQWEESQATAATTPIRKLSRNRGLILQEQSVGEGVADNNESTTQDSPVTVCDYEQRAADIRKGKRKML